MGIDLVYNYVNSDDMEWVERRNKYAKDNNNSECRFRDNSELRYSLRSVEKYASWINKIYIVMDSKAPEWLNESNTKIQIVRHEEIMPQELLPCYNSTVIEFHIDNIPELSDVFIYANDDMFFGNYVDESFFVKDGKPVVRMTEFEVSPSNYYDRILYNSQMVIQKKFHKKFDLIPSHAIDVYSRSSIKECKEIFADDFSEIIKNRMRTNSDLHRVLYHYYLIIKNECVLKTYSSKNTFWDKSFAVLKRLLFPSSNLDFVAYNFDKFFNSTLPQMYFARGPKLVCLNDAESTTEEDLKKYSQLMNKKFKNKSSFEK